MNLLASVLKEDGSIDLRRLAPIAEVQAADLTFGDRIDIKRRQRAGEPVTAIERAALTAWHESPRAKKAMAAFREGNKALEVQDSMPKHHGKRYDDMTVAEARLDPVFQMYARRLQSTPSRSPRPVTTGCSRPRARRAGASSSTAGTDPPSESDQPADPLRLAPNARAVLVFGCLTADQRGGVVA